MAANPRSGLTWACLALSIGGATFSACEDGEAGAGPPIGAALHDGALSVAARRPGDAQTTARVRFWSSVALSASKMDHVGVAAGQVPIFAEQIGPTRTSRAHAIVHIAIFEAVNAIAGRYESYTGLPPAPAGASMDAAIAQAAHDALVALYPKQALSFHVLLALDLRLVPNGRAKAAGVALGRRAAVSILAVRADDGSEQPEPVVGVDYLPGDAAGEWRPDPISESPIALGPFWGDVTPFTLLSGAQYRVPPPPPLESAEYAAAFHEVALLGGDGVVTPTVRTLDETIAGIYWGYDGTPLIGARTVQYNQIIVRIAEQMGTGTVELARLLALCNIAMADGGIAAWDSKYHYRFWRPVTALRDAGRDGNPATEADPAFTPLGAPASNLPGQPDFTPPFPAYPSGHAVFGAAMFQMLRHFYGTDDIAFTFVSDEWNGMTLDNDGYVRPLIPRRFASLSEAEEENGQSRIYLGIHWAFDKTEGIDQGRAVADWVWDRVYRPR
jgi:membrane-associated phospholipid phosphatase